MESESPSHKRSRRKIAGRGEDGRQGREDGHKDRGLINLHPAILHSIMVHVSQSLKDHFNTVAVIRTLRRVADDEVFLRAIDLFTVEFPPIIDDTSIVKLLTTCCDCGNISAMFIRGCLLFFPRGDMDNGISLIRDSAIAGYKLGVYVYANLRRIITPHLEVELLSPNRDLVRHMRRRLEQFSHFHWGRQPIPQLYVDRCASFDSSIIKRCQCAWSRGWDPLYEKRVKDLWMCDSCFYAIHVLGFLFNIPHRVMEWPMQ